MRVLPSGDEIATWRLIVGRTGPPTGPKVDVIEVTGSLRRRFWRGSGGVQSRCEVEVATAGRSAVGGG